MIGEAGGEHRLEGILSLVAERRGIDFRDYRRDTLMKRIESRMGAMGCLDLAEYEMRLRCDATEVDRLAEALVVPVTAFFRDPAVFRELRDVVLPPLLGAAGSLRVWVVGTATGEEAYTVALLLAEASARQRGGGFEVIASDVDRRSLEIARKGVYGEQALLPVPADLRERYFRREVAGFRTVDSIRGRIWFAEHDLVGPLLAPPEAVVAAFSLVLCRNVLLYFDGSLRAKAAERLAAVVEPQGALVLGSAESLPDSIAPRFRPWPGTSAAARIFRRGPD